MLLETGPYQITLMTVPPVGEFHLPTQSHRFPMLLLDSTAKLHDGTMERIAEGFVAAGCRYAICAGVRASEWETAFDKADLKRNPNCDEDRFVMTTTCTEGLEEAIFELLFTTSSDAAETSFVIAVVDGKDADFAKIASAVEKVRKNPA